MTEKAVAGMVGAAIRYQASYKQLIGVNYAESQIPAWIARPDWRLPPEEPPEADEAAEAPAAAPEELKDLEELPSSSGTFKDLPTLADLKVPVETPPHRTVELKAP